MVVAPISLRWVEITSSATATQEHYAPRQVTTIPLAATSTSSFDWWPYPSWGASTASTTTLISLATPLQTAVRPVESSTAGSVSGPATTSLIHISALPPANSSSSNNFSKSGSHSSFNIAYLAPLFGVLSALAGALVTWLLLRRYLPRGGRRAREALLEPGPRYISPPGTLADDRQALTHETSSLGGNSSMLSAPSQQQTQQAGWLSRAFSASMPSSQTTSAAQYNSSMTNVGPSLPPHTNDRFSSREDDPFIDLSLSTYATNSGVGGQPSGSRFVEALTSPGLFADEEEAVPYDTLRHKSIRRGILERLKFGTLRRPTETVGEESDVDVHMPAMADSPTRRVGRRQGHKRQDSDLNVEDVNDVTRAHSMTTPSRTISVDHASRDVSPLLSGPGFRIIEEDTEADARAAEQRARLSTEASSTVSREGSEEASSWTWLSAWSSSSGKQEAPDTYTSMPARRNATEKRNSPFSTPVKSRTSAVNSPAPAMSRAESSILPSSPPRIMSPPLESKLFFGSLVAPDFGVNPVLNLQMPSVGSKSTDQFDDVSLSHAKKRNKLHTKKEPPLLPFPSTSADSPYRKRLKKSTKLTPSNSPSVDPERIRDSGHISSSPSPNQSAGRQSIAERLKARQSALDKVDEIVSRSWNQRDVSIDVFIGSPTLFGALPADPHLGTHVDDASQKASAGGGIEQRMEAFRTNRHQ